MTVAEDHRAPGTDIVDVTTTIFAFEPGTCGALEKNRFTADPGKGSYRGVHATGDDVSGVRKITHVQISMLSAKQVLVLSYR